MPKRHAKSEFYREKGRARLSPLLLPLFPALLFLLSPAFFPAPALFSGFSGRAATAANAAEARADVPDEAATEELRSDLRSFARKKRVQLELPAPGAPRERKERDYETPLTISRIVVFAAGVGALFLLVMMLVRRGGTGPAKQKDPEGKKDEEATRGEKEKLAKKLLRSEEDADGLAAAGLHAEAMHKLLLDSLNEFRKRDASKLKDFLTSRELLPILPLNVRESEALGDLVRRVEVSHFGNAEPGEEDWKASKESFAKLIRALRGSPGENPGKSEEPKAANPRGNPVSAAAPGGGAFGGAGDGGPAP
ncbi:MAG: hypothetical protein LBF41_06140 [Deltaproteobacteria bacterium]|jgi:hypothetical protein|nr:hypothetical protein [Deltaproteobacteria bacterium]